MQAVNHIINARWIITCEPGNKILENHALIIHNNKILDILPSKQATELYTAVNTENYSTHVVMPGLINSHTHLAMSLFRGLADDLALMDWLQNHIWPAEKTWVNTDFVYDGSLLAMAEMIRSGSTCFNDMYFFLADTARAAELAGVRANIGITVIGVPTAWAQTFDEYIAKGMEFYHAYKNHNLITTTFAPHAIYTAAESILPRVHELAEAHDLKINMHIHETADEVNGSIAQTNMRPIKRLQKMGLISPRLIAIHMTQINDEDLEILAAGKPSIVRCPESNMKLASGIAPYAAFKQIGLNVALGTDGAASNNDLDMLGEMRTLALLSKLTSNDPTAQNAQETLGMATLNGARALGIDKVTGSLTKGKAADFIAINLDELETLPVYHPDSHIVYAASRHQVTDVWVAGKPLMKNRELLTLDEEKIKANARAWAKKIKNY